MIEALAEADSGEDTVHDTGCDDWHVVFRRSTGKIRFWPFNWHCYAVWQRDNHDSIVLEASFDGLDLIRMNEQAAWLMIEQEIRAGASVVAWKYRPFGPGTHLGFPMTCVSVLAKALRVPGGPLFTPMQLKRRLLAQGGRQIGGSP